MAASVRCTRLCTFAGFDCVIALFDESATDVGKSELMLLGLVSMNISASAT
jgi:hypothetical protein